MKNNQINWEKPIQLKTPNPDFVYVRLPSVQDGGYYIPDSQKVYVVYVKPDGFLWSYLVDKITGEAYNLIFSGMTSEEVEIIKPGARRTDLDIINVPEPEPIKLDNWVSGTTSGMSGRWLIAGLVLLWEDVVPKELQIDIHTPWKGYWETPTRLHFIGSIEELVEKLKKIGATEINDGFT